MAVAGEAVGGILADALVGHAATLKGLSATQDVATISGREGGTEGGRSRLGVGAGGVVSGSPAGVATGAGRGEDSRVAARTAHDVHAGFAVVCSGTTGLTLCGPLSGTATDSLALCVGRRRKRKGGG